MPGTVPRTFSVFQIDEEKYDIRRAEEFLEAGARILRFVVTIAVTLKIRKTKQRQSSSRFSVRDEKSTKGAAKEPL